MSVCCCPVTGGRRRGVRLASARGPDPARPVAPGAALHLHRRPDLRPLRHVGARSAEHLRVPVAGNVRRPSAPPRLSSPCVAEGFVLSGGWEEAVCQDARNSC
eukprot:6083567-Alexandrium_andersonii.AAC.1